MARKYKTKYWRLVRPEGMDDASWKAFKKVHGRGSGEGKYIFGVPPGTGALQDAANDGSMAKHDDKGHHIDWRADDKVAPSIKEHRGDLTNKATKAMMKAHKMTPSAARKAAKAAYYTVDYGPDGRAK